jgi:catechol 2,3-dioxygenase-like lactoylglutathione lyase family enzyme
VAEGLYHLSINVSDTTFYKDLLTCLGFRLQELEYGFGAFQGECSLWVFQVQPRFKDRGFHRKAIGLNHLAFRVSRKEAVDVFYNDYLKPNRLTVLYGGPKAYPEYAPGYYAVFFEDPDRIKLEVVYNPSA